MIRGPRRPPRSLHGAAGDGAAGHVAAALVAAGLLALLAAGCGDDPPPPMPVTEPTAEPSWNPEVRRPPWRFVFDRTGERCVVRRIDDNERITEGEEAACPVDLQRGERIRLAGSVCLREGVDKTRVLPVTCPDALTNAERDFLRERKLIPPD